MHPRVPVSRRPAVARGGIGIDPAPRAGDTFGPMDRLYRAVVDTGRAILAFQGLRFRITGVENIPPTGPAIMVFNHTNYLDFMFSGLVADMGGRYIRFMCKDAVFRNPVAGPLLRTLHQIPVDREAGAQSYRAAVAALNRGEIVGVFPEATISRSFELKQFKSGAVRMAQASGAPLLPMVTWGGQRLWSKGKPKRLGRTKIPVAIRVGEPYVVPPDASLVEATAELKRRMQAMLDIEQREYPPMRGSDLQFVPRRLGGTAPTLEEATAMDLAEVAERRALRAQRDAEAAKRGRSR